MAKKKIETPDLVALSTTIQKRSLSLDLGNAFSNLRTDNGVADDWRSIMAPMTEANRLGQMPAKDVMFYEGQWWATGAQCYTLAQDQIIEKTSLARYTSKWYRRLFAFALHRAFEGLVGKEIVYPHVITSVPARLFKNKSEAEAIKRNLIGEYCIGNVRNAELHVKIQADRLVIIPEGIGTYFGYAFGPGQNAKYADGSWMIGDFGFYTLDGVRVRNGDYIADASRSDSNTGISIVADAVCEWLYSQTHVELDRAEVDQQLDNDCIIVHGRPYPIKDIKSDALRALGVRASEILEQWSAHQNLSGLILAGGGTNHIVPYIDQNRLPPVTVASNPRRSNVEGAYLYITAE